MNILVMGGTLFAGRAVVAQALADGHRVTMFNRGVTNPGLFPEAEHLQGDRNIDLSVLEGRRFDEVVDTSAYFPRQVRTLVEALQGRIGHYSLVSSCSVYAEHDRPGADETAELDGVPSDLDVETTTEVGEHYGALKAMCEQTLDELLPGRGHHVRAGLIVGPHDNTGRFTYWVRRLAEGGDVLAPGPRDQPVQFIDVRDLAAWILRASDTGVTGPINATGIPGVHTMESMLAEIVKVVGGEPNVEWVPETFLAEHDVAPWSDLPLWLPPVTLPTHVGFMARSVSAALAGGLELRPLADTVLDTLSWVRSASEAEGGAGSSKDYGNPPDQAGLSPERERQLLAEFRATNEGR